MNSASTIQGMVTYWLVCGDAYYPVEGDAPTGIYGDDWCVVMANTGREAVKIADASAMYEEDHGRDSRIVSEAKARDLFSKEIA